MSEKQSRATQFSLGRTVITRGALAELAHADVQQGIARHVNGDWGDLCEQDKHVNDNALKYGARLLSAYHTTTGVKFWIITEADRSATTVLLPEEY